MRPPRIPRALGRFARDTQGVSAVEFALVLPIMLTLFLNGIALGQGSAIQFKTARAARTVADLAARYPSLDTATLSSILNAAKVVLAPYPTTTMKMTVSEISTDSKGAATYTWSCALGATAHTFGAAATLPGGISAANISVILGEVTYAYTPPISYTVVGPINITQKMYFYPRMGAAVTGPSTSASCPTS